MIPMPYIADWQELALWPGTDQVEQDLLISRILVIIFKDEFLSENLAFRGGTALHKLYLKPAPRYSEDIDLVQIKPGPIKPIMERLGELITFFDLPRNTRVSGHGAKVFHKFTSEYEGLPLRLKIEINCREHFKVLDWVEIDFACERDWFTGETKIKTYSINELLGTKLRALYQRSKGRDLFDLDYARLKRKIDIGEILHCFKVYIKASTGNRPPSAKEFLMNMETKEQDGNFAGDM